MLESLSLERIAFSEAEARWLSEEPRPGENSRALDRMAEELLEKGNEGKEAARVRNERSSD